MNVVHYLRLRLGMTQQSALKLAPFFGQLSADWSTPGGQSAINAPWPLSFPSFPLLQVGTFNIYSIFLQEHDMENYEKHFNHIFVIISYYLSSDFDV